MMIRALRMSPGMPKYLEAGVLYFFAAVVLVLAHAQRRAIRRNLAVILGDLAWAEGIVGAYRVFVNFGWTYIDGLRTRLGQEVITWEIEGMGVFEKLRDTEGAAMIFTTHTGNYDLAAALFSEKFGRDLHTVRAPERSALLQEIRRGELERDTARYGHFKVHYNASESLLGVELARLLMAGELVAIQSDRVVGGVAGLKVEVGRDGEKMRIPRGPMMLAALARSPCFPLHVVRGRYRHYRILFREPLEVAAEGGGRRVREGDYARVWAVELMEFLQAHAFEWFVFEEAFEG